LCDRPQPIQAASISQQAACIGLNANVSCGLMQAAGMRCPGRIGYLYGVKKRKRRKLLDPVELGRKRWKGVSKAERSEILRRAVQARWAKARKAKNAKNGPKAD
jgi:hypothetical protein